MEALNDFLLPPAKSNMAAEVDPLFNFIHIVSFILLIGITAAMIYFIIKYRRKSDNEVTPVMTHNNKLEITWSVIPLILVLIVFGWGFKGFMNMNTAPDDAYEIKVTAQKWLWRFTYKNGAQATGELHVPVNRPVKLVMSSSDVIHSFYVPDFRVKRDVVPGRYTSVWFNALETGESIIFCTEYCGTDHSNMSGTVIVHEQDDFDLWLESNAGGTSRPNDLTPAEWGRQLVEQNACLVCHSTDGTTQGFQGPTWQGLFGSERHFEDGTSIIADENYIRESMLEPNTKVVEGYLPVMTAYQGALSDGQIDAIIEYIKSLD